MLCSVCIQAQNPDEQQIANTVDADTVAEDELGSDFVLRVDYQSKVLSSGRDFGVSQYGFSPSLIYYHKSGLYGSATGSIYSQSSPKYSLTDFTLGYSNVFNFAQSWSYSVSYDRYLFNPDSDGLLKNAGTAYTNYDFGPVNAGISYTFMFSSEETAHRLNPSIAGYFVIRKVGFIDKISFSPSVSATIGTSNVPFSKFTSEQFTAGQGLTWQDRQELRKEVIVYYKENYPGLYAQYLAYRKNTGVKITFKKYAESKGVTVVPPSSTGVKESFGVMCWTFSLPVKFKIGNLGIGVTYNFVMPQLLPDEVYTDLSNQSYISANISYTFSTK